MAAKKFTDGQQVTWTDETGTHLGSVVRQDPSGSYIVSQGGGYEVTVGADHVKAVVQTLTTEGVGDQEPDRPGTEPSPALTTPAGGAARASAASADAAKQELEDDTE